jgi:hypothetical protein
VGRAPSSWLRSRPTGNAASVQSARLVYDETGSGKSVDCPEIRSSAQNAALVGLLEHHQETTEGSYSIVLADGDGTFISPVTPPSAIAQCSGSDLTLQQDFYNSIPETHRPPINLLDAGKPVKRLFYKDPILTMGSIMMPIILKTANTNEYIKLVLNTFVVPELVHPVFVSWKALVALKPEWGFWFTDNGRKMVVHLENEHGVFNIMGA